MVPDADSPAPTERNPRPLRSRNNVSLLSKHARTGWPKASILVSSYAAVGLLRDTLSSLARLDYPDFEVILVDAGSGDGTVELVREEYPWVRLVEVAERVGIGAALNIGAREAGGEVLVLDFNTDEVARSDWLTALVTALREAPQPAIVGGVRLVFGSDVLVDECGMTISPLGLATKRFRGRRLSECPQAQPQPVGYVGVMGLYRSTYEQLGPMDETLYIFGEDAEYCMRLRSRGGQVFVTPHAVTWHRGSGVLGRDGVAHHYYLRRSMLAVALKHLPVWQFFLVFLGFIAVLVIDLFFLLPIPDAVLTRMRFPLLAYRRSLSHVWATLKAYGWNLRNVGTFLRQRHAWSPRPTTI